MKTSLFVVLMTWALIAQGNYSGIAYEQNSNRQKPLFTYNNTRSDKEGVEEVLGVWKDPSGQVVIEERGQVKAGQILRYEIDQKQLGQRGLVEVKEGKIYFTKMADGKSSTESEKLTENFVMGPNFFQFIKNNWSAISSGKTVSMRWGVWDRQETVGFEVFKTGDTTVDGQKAILLKMKPSSFVIAALVKPLIFTYAVDGSHLLIQNGRVTPKKKDGSSFKDLDAEMVYSY